MTFADDERLSLVTMANGRMTFVLLFIRVIQKPLYYIVFGFGDKRIKLRFPKLRRLSNK